MEQEKSSSQITTKLSRPIAPLSITFDRAGMAHFRPTKSTATGAARFRNFQTKLLNGALIFINKSSQFAANLIAFDGVLTKSDLIAALAQQDQLYTWNGHTGLEWLSENKRINRRFISFFTEKDWTPAQNVPLQNHEDILTSLEVTLEKIYPSKGISNIDQLLHDAQAWAFEALPGPLLAHCISAVPLTLLPRKTLAREESRKALHSSAEQLMVGEASLGLASALDGYFSHGGKDHGGWLINKLVVACRHKKQVADHIDKRRILKECLALSSESDSAGKTASIVLAWAIDLIESGTPSEKNVNPGTVDLYVRYAAPSLHEHFKDENLEEIDPEKFIEIYSTIIKSATPGVQKTLASALNSWHRFIQYWLDASPIKKSLYLGIEQSTPRANVIWPHEKELIEIWIVAATCDERMMNQIHVCHAIATSLRIRVSELLKLRMRNIRIHGVDMEIEICPMRRDGNLKTPSAQRVVLICSGTAITTISNWVVRRKCEGALLDDLLFGNPHKPAKGYKLGLLYVILNQLLKCATGDPDISFHSYSHDWISNKIEKALLSNTRNDINPLDIIAAEVGHSSSQTSLLHYFHFIEKPLRYFLDSAIQRLPLSSKIVSRYSNISPATLRQRSCRSKLKGDNDNIYWLAMTNSSQHLFESTASSSFEFENARPPSSLTKLKSTSFSDVFYILSDLAEGMSVLCTSSRAGHPEHTVYQIASIACDLLRQIGMLDMTLVIRSQIDAVANFQISFSGENINPIRFDRINQLKLNQVYLYLSQQIDPTVLESACCSWINCFKQGYLSLDKPSQSAGIIKFLHAAKVTQNRIIVCTSLNTEDTAQHLQSQITAIFSSIFALPPLFDTKAPRRGRPNNYLVISGVEPQVGNNLESAAISMKGFNALLFAACVSKNFGSNIFATNHTEINFKEE